MKPLTFHQVREMFFRPLFKYPIWISVASVIVGIAFFIGANVGIAEVIRQNNPRLHMLSAELLLEFDPDLLEKLDPHIIMIEQYSGHLERGHLGLAIKWLYPQYSLEKQIAPSLVDFENATTNEEASEALQKAGMITLQLYEKGKKFPESPKTWFNSEKLSNELTEDIDESIVLAAEKVKKLESDMNVEAAMASCRANRRAILLLSLGQLGYNDKEEIQRFLNIVMRARDATQGLVDKKENELLYKVVQSEDRRIKILQARLNGNTHKACKILGEAIEKAYKEDVKP